MLHVGIRRINREHALSSSYTFRASLVPVMQVDTQDLCKAMADLGGYGRHCRAVSGRE
jgi:hypothetical protein